MGILIMSDNKKDRRYMKPGVAGIFLTYIFFSVMLVFLFGFGVPFLMAWYVQMYSAGQTIMTSSNIQNQINQIQDPGMKSQIQSAFTVAQGSIADNISILGFFFKYSWLVVTIVIVFMLFMRSRVLVETQQGIV